MNKNIIRFAMIIMILYSVTGFLHSRSEPVAFSQNQITIDGDLKTFKPMWKSETQESGLFLVTLTLTSAKPAVPPHFTLKWSTPSVDIFGFWTPLISLDKSTYYNSQVQSRAVRYAPVIALYNNAEQNRITVAISDTLNSVTIGTYLKEEDVRFHHSIECFKEKTPAIKEYSVSLRVDTRPVNFAQALSGVSQWWARLKNHAPAPVPQFAKQPMYSTWYSFHQNITADEVVKQCKLARRLGFQAVIVDDGWQTLDSQRGYAYTGDWKPVRIGDMANFVNRVHGLGMKFLLWYSVSLVGEKSGMYKTFKGKYLWYWEGQGAWVLDPRFPDVRQYIVDTYVNAQKAWKLDGFKLDFIGMFRPDKNTIFKAIGGRDYASIDKAVDRLMTDIIQALRQVNPKIMIEFRQPYIGPLMRKYGNMFRAADCPNMALVNRVRTTDIRLLSGDTAVHSDMFAWHDNEAVEHAALQILNILFSVPQLSVKLDNFSHQHNQMIRFWINYWNRNKVVLIDGKFMPEGPQANYPVIKAEARGKTIAAVYADRVIKLSGTLSMYFDLVNAKSSDVIVADFEEAPGEVKIEIFDCMGNAADQSYTELKSGLHKFKVPPSGLVQITRKH